MMLENYLGYIAALLFVLGLIGAFSFMMKYALHKKGGVFNLFPEQVRRIEIREIKALDSRRRLFLIRRDNVEHLIMTGGPNDLLIETGIPEESPQQNSKPGVTIK